MDQGDQVLNCLMSEVYCVSGSGGYVGVFRVGMFASINPRRCEASCSSSFLSQLVGSRGGLRAVCRSGDGTFRTTEYDCRLLEVETGPRQQQGRVAPSQSGIRRWKRPTLLAGQNTRVARTNFLGHVTHSKFAKRLTAPEKAHGGDT